MAVSRRPSRTATSIAGRKSVHGQGPVRRPVRRTLHQSHGGVMFNRPPAHGNPDSPAALAAASHNQMLMPIATRLKKRGKPHKLVIIAVARRLVIIANRTEERRVGKGCVRTYKYRGSE